MSEYLENLSLVANAYDEAMTGPSTLFMRQAKRSGGHNRIVIAGVILCDHNIKHGFWEMRASSVLVVPAGPRYVADEKSKLSGYRIDQLLTFHHPGNIDLWTKLK